NLVDSSVNVELRTFLRSKDGKEIATAKSKLIKLPPKSKRTLSVTLPYRIRGEIEAVASYRTERLSEKLEAVHPFRIPPLVDLKLKRSIFVLSDALEIAVKLTPPIGRKAKCTVTIQNENSEILWQSKPLVKSETLSLPARKLSSGRYKLKASAIVEGKDGEKGMTEKAFEVVKMERPKLLVRVGSKGELLIDGEPVFPIGTYHVGAEDLKQVKELGFNCVTSPIYGGEQSELTEDQKNWHDEAHRQGLWVITELSEYIRSGRRNFEQARQVVSWLRIHPATILHYAIDEPLGGGISRDLVKQFCRLIKEVDPEHPTFVNEVPGEVVKYADTADITGTDPYPVGVEVPKSLAWVGLSIRQAVKAAKGRPVWGVIQSHRQPPAHSQNRYPTPDEIRCMAYLALNNGAKGLLFYAWGDIHRDERGEWVSGFKYSEELQKFFQQFNRELTEIGLHYALGQIRRDVIKIEPKDAPLDAVWLEHSNVKMAVIVNTSSSIVNASIITPNAKFEHNFKPFEVKIVR
ncbi:MAG: beta-galactosidase, partial [Armatimonadetes bacterium]|nr:beta-galactosidase [Armatimonadota bacterium]